MNRKILNVLAVLLVVSFAFSLSQPALGVRADTDDDSPAKQQDQGGCAGRGGAITGRSDFKDFTCKVINIINDAVIPLVLALALVYFLWGVFQFIMAGDNEEKKKVGKERMIWGIIALFVMVAVWGLVNILINTFFTESALKKPNIPQF